jgi:molybdate transport system regulatory protein
MTTKPSRKKACAAVIVRPRIQFGPALAIGPGKIDLLRAVAETHSISAAARALGLTYKRAWLLIDTLNAGFGRPVVETATGGRGGGGARLTPLGEQLVARYDALEARLNAAARAELAALGRLTG